MRKIALDTETTGLLFYESHKIIEIGCIEMIDNQITQNKFHTYINPSRTIDEEAKKITGLTEKFLSDKPKFIDIIDNFFKFLNGCDEIIIHNANFDINFINYELQLCNYEIKTIHSQFKIFDTLSFARKLYPGKKNNLNALSERYNIKEDRTWHGALLDAYILAKIYIEMNKQIEIDTEIKPIINKTKKFKILKTSGKELKSHINYINNLKDYAK